MPTTKKRNDEIIFPTSDGEYVANINEGIMFFRRKPKQTKRKPWIPKEEEKCYTLDGNGYIEKTIFWRFKDMTQAKFLGVYRTKREAQEAKKKVIKALWQ